MIFRPTALANLLLPALLVVLASCGSGTQPDAPPVTTDNIARSSTLPGVGQLDVLYRQRHGMPATDKVANNLWDDLSTWLSGLWYGSEPLASSVNTTVVDDTSLEINTTLANPFGYAVYPIVSPNAEPLSAIRIPLIGNDGGTMISDNSASLVGAGGSTLVGDNGASLIGNDGGTIRHYALANFEEKRWDFVDTMDNGVIMLDDMPAPAVDYASPLGVTYVAPLVYNTQEPITVKISSVTGLPCEPSDTTVPPEAANFDVEGIRGALHFSWGALGDSNTFVKVYICDHPFTTYDPGQMVCMNYEGAEREAIFTWISGHTAYVRVQTHHAKSCLDSALSAQFTAQTLEGDPLIVEVDVSPSVADAGAPAVATATGGTSYDWDLDNDGLYEITGDATGVMQVSADGKPGIRYGRVKGYDGTGAFCIRGFAVYRRGWFTANIDNSDYAGPFVQMVILADGRPAVCYLTNVEEFDPEAIRYLTPSDKLGLGTWDMQELESGYGYVRKVDMKLVNETPLIFVGQNGPAPGDKYRLLSTSSPSGAAGSWKSLHPNWEVREPRYGSGLLGNDNTAANPGPFYIVYDGADDEDLDGFDVNGNVKVVTCTVDGNGDVQLGASSEAIPDPDGEDGNNSSLRTGAIGMVGGKPVAFAYHNDSPTGQDRDLLYTHLDGIWSSPVDLPMLYSPAEWGYDIFEDARHHLSFFTRENGAAHYYVGDAPEFTYSTLIDVPLVNCDGLIGPAVRYMGGTLQLAHAGGNYLVLSSLSTAAVTPDEWRITPTTLNGTKRNYPNGCIAIVDGHIAIAHFNSDGLPGALTYSIQF